MGVGRETTADRAPERHPPGAYLMGVGRETTAKKLITKASFRAYLMGVGRETTARLRDAARAIPSLPDGSR